MIAAPVVELCPRCALRGIEDEASGWCRQCAEAAAVERYRDRNDRDLSRRRDAWKRRTALSDAPAALAERQRQHRLIEQTRPHEFPDESTDPLELCKEGLRELRQVQAAVRGNTRAHGHIERVEEVLKQLGWGPESDQDEPAPVRTPERTTKKPFKRRKPARTFACTVCGDERTTFSPTAKYCSAACNVEAYRQRKRESESV